MKIELRNVHHVASMSEETPCFDAIIYIDGSKACRVSNHGQGGPHEFDSREVEDRLSEYARTLPDVVTDMRDPHDRTKPFTYKQDAEHIIGNLLEEFLSLRDFRRDVKSRVLFTKADGRLYHIKPKDRSTLPRVLEKVRAKEYAKDAVHVLNFMAEAEALPIYLKAGAQ